MSHERKVPAWIPLAEAGLEMFTPFGAALAAFALHCNNTFYLMLGGWLMAILHIYLQGPMILEDARAKWTRAAIGILLPRLAIAAAQLVAENGSVWRYFLDQALVDLVTLGASLIFIFWFKKGVSGRSAWKDLGPFMVLLVSVIFAGSSAGFVLCWWETLHDPGWQYMAGMGIGFVLGMRYRVRILANGFKNNYNPDAAPTGNETVILVLLGVWALPLPLLGWLISVLV